MKKTVTVILSLAILIATVSMFSLSAFAETTSKYWEPRPGAQDAESYVNGESFGEIYSEADPESGGTKITYGGSGKLIDWEFPLLEEGKDYEIVTQKGNSITIKLLTESHELPYINALVNFENESTSKTNNAEVNSENQNKGNNITDKSPDKSTNKKVIAYSCIGVCVIACITAGIVLKKKKSQ